MSYDRMMSYTSRRRPSRRGRWASSRCGGAATEGGDLTHQFHPDMVMFMAAEHGSAESGGSPPEANGQSDFTGPELAPREREVLIAWLLTDNKDAVARTLHIAPTTVRTHLQRVRAKYA